jgi:prolipoprotein diacylglyceryl transferase
LSYFVWDVSPVLISYGNFGIAWYGLLFATGFFFGFQIMRWVYQREGKTGQSLDRIFIYMVLGAVAGARLGHCLFYDPAYYLANPLSILKIWEGGLASHGGTVGMIIAIYVYAKQTDGIRFLWLLDRMTIPVALGSFFIRLGNFFNSEIIGIPTTVPWAVIFSRVDNLPRHPAQLYEALVYLSLFILLFSLYKKHGKDLRAGLLISLLMLIIFGTRFFIEFIKMPQEAFDPISGLNMGQWLSIPFILLGAIFIFLSQNRINKH